MRPHLPVIDGQADLSRRSRSRRIAMKTSLTASSREARAGSFTAALMVAAMLALMAAAKTAKASDQQATETQIAAELSYRAVQADNIAAREYPSDAYAQAISHQRGFGSGTTVPDRDFQLEGR
jgi:hypothetical protein